MISGAKASLCVLCSKDVRLEKGMTIAIFGRPDFIPYERTQMIHVYLNYLTLKQIWKKLTVCSIALQRNVRFPPT